MKIVLQKKGEKKKERKQTIMFINHPNAVSGATSPAIGTF